MRRRVEHRRPATDGPGDTRAIADFRKHGDTIAWLAFGHGYTSVAHRRPGTCHGHPAANKHSFRIAEPASNAPGGPAGPAAHTHTGALER